MRLKTKDFAIALYTATADTKGKDLHAVLGEFVQILAKHQMLKKAERIIAEYVAYAKRQEGILDIQISSARKLDAATIEKVKNAFGEKVEATESLDESLLGGFVVKTTDTIFDASIKKQLVRLKQSLV